MVGQMEEGWERGNGGAVMIILCLGHAGNTGSRRDEIGFMDPLVADWLPYPP